MKKLKLFMILSLILTVFSISALYVSAATSTGRWTVSKARYSFLTSSQEKIFSKAVDDLDGVNYEPVALPVKLLKVSSPDIAWHYADGKNITAGHIAG